MSGQTAPGGPEAVELRQAVASDLDGIVQLLADDPLGARRERYERPLPAGYGQAFAAIEADPNQELWVACREQAVVGVLQVTFIPYLTYQGGWRALIEGVRTARHMRSHGLGARMLRCAIERARLRGCHMVQLTTDKARPDALRFYQSLGFVASHEGLKLFLAEPKRE